MATTNTTNEGNTHGGPNDNESVTQKVTSHQSSTIRKAVAQSRPPINLAETIIKTLFPKQ